MKHRYVIIIVLVFLLLFFTACTKEHFSTGSDLKTIVSKTESFEIEAKQGKTITLEYDLNIKNGTITFLMLDINQDTLLYQSHIRSLKGSYYIAKSDTNNYMCEIFTNNLIGNYIISCKSG